MEFSYTCHNSNCSYPGKDRFSMTIDEQSVMDDKNMAVVFCPFCKQQMTLSVISGNAQIGKKSIQGRIH